MGWSGELVDLRSDTVTKPSPGMRAAMAEAEVGEDVYGEDPTVNALLAEVKELLGFSGALFMPSGIMANQIAVRLLVQPGQELVCDSEAHLVSHEGAGLAWHGGIQTRTVFAERGLIEPGDLRKVLRVGNPYTVGTTAVALEQTHNRGGGSVYPLDTLRRIRAAAAEVGAAVHIDGARIWNAHIANGVPLAEYGALADTMSVSFSKALGAPIGSVLLADADRIDTARWLRQRLGGGMHQSGLLAAAARYALAHHLPSIAADHANAALLAERLAGAGCRVRPVETNIVLLDVPGAPELAARAAEHGVLVSAFGPELIRLVTHRDVRRRACERAAEVLLAAGAAGPE
ncbi:low specificity L-threonine aldolase [Kitasatospora acidiphila]|uniref:Low specificity L-threonine aldolase n=1 Tax=Kitasatospora acidiphila TaxID=2567942 RepID=A0A540VYR7_9ACTN|nr:GntG family PLP-dependent aldolase [Kitasatospora acidiphila]TQF01916.1 low specificity L-threonine aldolase [Kitasatospora acidiphila]